MLMNDNGLCESEPENLVTNHVFVDNIDVWLTEPVFDWCVRYVSFCMVISLLYNAGKI